MHFFYIDETGCTGADLKNAEQPIFVIGGIDVTDEKWRETHAIIRDTLKDFYGETLPKNFELHARDLINGEGYFTERSARSAMPLDNVRNLSHFQD
jgi:Protein of unknown function (DUF3800)